jgi:hypothetical protein
MFGPRLFITDLALSKDFAIRERIRLRFEVQAQNAFNHPNLANPNSCIDCSVSSGAGQITDILGGTFAEMRQLQFDARFKLLDLQLRNNTDRYCTIIVTAVDVLTPEGPAAVTWMV